MPVLPTRKEKIMGSNKEEIMAACALAEMISNVLLESGILEDQSTPNEVVIKGCYLRITQHLDKLEHVHTDEMAEMFRELDRTLAERVKRDVHK